MPVDMTLIRLDFTAKSVGDTSDPSFQARLSTLQKQANARVGVTDEQREAGVRAQLIRRQLMVLAGKVEELTAVGEVSIVQGIKDRAQVLRAELNALNKSAGFSVSEAGPQSTSIPIDVVS